MLAHIAAVADVLLCLLVPRQAGHLGRGLLQLGAAGVGVLQLVVVKLAGGEQLATWSEVPPPPPLGCPRFCVLCDVFDCVLLCCVMLFGWSGEFCQVNIYP